TKDIETLKTLDYHPLDEGTAREIVHFGRRHGVDQLCCDDPHGHGKLVIEGISESNLALRRYLDRYRESVVEVENLLNYLDHSPIQLMFSGPCDPMDVFASLLSEQLGDRIQLFKTRYRAANLTILDALSPTASKGRSLAAIARLNGIDRAEVMAVGDNHNDLTMLRFAGTGVVMANAEEELRQMDFAVTLSNEEDGVAVAIERYIFNRTPGETGR
ncbi:MAG: HAD hydrolase family protein, partial [Acidobacteriota bacterium]